GVETGRGGVVDGGKQHGVLDREPVQGLLVVAGVLRGDTGYGRGEGDRVPAWVQQPYGGVRGVQVVIQQAGGGGVAVRGGGDAAGANKRVAVEGGCPGRQGARRAASPRSAPPARGAPLRRAARRGWPRPPGTPQGRDAARAAGTTAPPQESTLDRTRTTPPA